MVDSNNTIGLGNLINSSNGLSRSQTSQKTQDGADFKSLLSKSINEVNRLQADAEQVTTNFATGKTDNVAEVFTAVKKADIAFQTLMEIRNKLMDAYQEVKDMKV